MKEINHFSHKDHPLNLVNWETVVGVGDDNDEKKDATRCYGCQEPITSGLAYVCITCSHFLHETCAELAPTFIHHQHPVHPLTLEDNIYTSRWFCNVCGKRHIIGGFSYCCSPCDFDVCVKCVSVAAAQKATAAALEKEALTKLKHKGHPEHTLTLQLRPATFHCDACNIDERDLFYRCDGCEFWIHKTCAFLDPTIHHPGHPNHPLVLVFSLPSNFYNYAYFCAFCNKCIQRNDWLYHCANCRYFAHIKCALNAEYPSTTSDTTGTSVPQEPLGELLHFPMSNAFTDPLKVLNSKKTAQDDEEKKEITNWSHNHTLRLNVEPQGNNTPNSGCSDDIKLCNGCARPISHPYYNCKDGCSFILHKYCAELPLTLEHRLHPNHMLFLVSISRGKRYHRCDGCFSDGNTFMYKCETCKFDLDVNCAFLPNMIKHESHKHPLIQVIDPKPFCKACDNQQSSISYACKECDFQLCIYCAVRSPRSLTHRYCKGHEIPLIYPPIEDHPEEFFCDICEWEMNPMYPLYHCLECRNSFHLFCLTQFDHYANVKHGHSMKFSYHKHPLKFIRRKKTPEYVCFYCNIDSNNRLILECQTGNCPFRVCMACHQKNRWALFVSM
ncbi:hypothetical protein OSB04_030350 [Centaurea solstitialis]|uniref:Zinc finger PHD-type domain-containing protein n=1 Tax=Centaurea solstitialis TaxID=347529 RepID=A0AA38VWL8_9ASTR|nr:hypothetical protein OSB04_030350 [Centaurea solstitialis]